MSWFKPVFAAASLLLASASFAAQTTGEWKEEAFEEDLDIRVYTREVANSPLKEFKGVTRVNVPTSALVALLKDSEAATEWMKDVVHYEMLEQVSETESVIYTINKAPWPVTNRDLVTRSIMSQDENKVVTVQITAEPQGKEINDDYIRIPELTGFWKFIPQENGVVEVVYQVHANPGGSLPTWLVNSIVIETPLETLTKMHDKVGLDKYQGKTYVFMQDSATQPVVAAE